MSLFLYFRWWLLHYFITKISHFISSGLIHIYHMCRGRYRRNKPTYYNYIVDTNLYLICLLLCLPRLLFVSYLPSSCHRETDQLGTGNTATIDPAWWSGIHLASWDTRGLIVVYVIRVLSICQIVYTLLHVIHSYDDC